MPGKRNVKPVQKAKDFKKTLNQLLSYCKEYLVKLIIAFTLMIISILLSVYGPTLTGNATTLISDGLISKYNGGSGIDFSGVYKILGTLIGIYVVSLFLNYFVNAILVDVAEDTSYRLRKDVSSKLNKLPLKYFDKHSHGEILSRVTNDIDNISQNLTNTVSSLLNAIVNIIGIVFMMLFISVKLALVAFITIPVSAFLASLLVKKSQKYFVNNQKYIGEVNGHVEEMFSGHQIVKVYDYEDDSIAKFEELNEELYNAGFKSQFLSNIMHPVTGFIGNLGYVVVVLLGGFEAISGRLKIGQIQSFFIYLRRLNEPVSSIAQLLNAIQSMMAAAERVFEVLDEQEEKLDSENPVLINDENGNSLIQGNVTFENVKFGYDPNKIIIHDFSMFVAPGKDVAIVGPTGAGKTTLVKLLMRFYELNGGAIYVDGKNINEYRRGELRTLFGMVLQDTWLFEGTVKENIKFSKPDATDEEVYEACRMAHVDHFIRTLEKGYDTIISEETSGISQGQKQLLTIARAFLADPKFLILDEATSSVDTRTEQLIQDSMEKLRKGRTAFTIAHRLSTIRNADIILVLNEGDIVEVGNHESLMKDNGFYAKLYNSQFAE